MPLTPDDLNRLPPEVQQELKEREKQQRIAALEYELRIKSRRWSGATIAALGAAIVSYPPSFLLYISDAYYPLVALFGFVAGWLAVHLRYSLMGGMVLIGSICILANFAGFALGLCPPLLFIWPLYVGVGVFVGLWAQGRRHMEDVGF